MKVAEAIWRKVHFGKKDDSILRSELCNALSTGVFSNLSTKHIETCYVEMEMELTRSCYCASAYNEISTGNLESFESFIQLLAEKRLWNWSVRR